VSRAAWAGRCVMRRGWPIGSRAGGRSVSGLRLLRVSYGGTFTPYSSLTPFFFFFFFSCCQFVIVFIASAGAGVSLSAVAPRGLRTCVRPGQRVSPTSVHLFFRRRTSRSSRPVSINRTLAAAFLRRLGILIVAVAAWIQPCPLSE